MERATHDRLRLSSKSMDCYQFSVAIENSSWFGVVDGQLHDLCNAPAHIAEHSCLRWSWQVLRPSFGIEQMLGNTGLDVFTQRCASLGFFQPKKRVRTEQMRGNLS